MTEPSVDERTPDSGRDHPPFRMRERRRFLLPDLRPPSLDEIRWAARQRRERRGTDVPQPRRPEAHGLQDEREQAAVVTATESTLVPDTAPEAHDTIVLPDLEAAPETDSAPEPVDSVAAVAPVAVEPADDVEPGDEVAAAADTIWLPDDDASTLPEPELSELEDPPFPELRPWYPAVLPAPESADDAEPSWVADVRPPAVEAVQVDVIPEPEPAPEPEPVEAPSATAEPTAPPLVSQVLVVREPAPIEPGQIAVLDELDVEAPPTVTRIVPLPVPAEEAGDLPVLEADFLDDAEVEPLAAEERGAIPLYWRLLRLRYTRPNGWLRALYFEGAVALAVVLVLAEAASVWTIVVLPFVVAVVVKANDVLAGSLRRTYRGTRRR